MVAECQPYQRMKTGLLSRYPLRENKGNLVGWFAGFMQVASKSEGILRKFPPFKEDHSSPSCSLCGWPQSYVNPPVSSLAELKLDLLPSFLSLPWEHK